MTIQDIYRIIDGYAPFSLQESWDCSGLLVGDPEKPVRRVMLTLDISIPVVQEAAAAHADVIVSHHPVIWDPIRTISPAHPVWHLIRNGIGAVCAHTNLDIAEGGLNDFAGKRMMKYLPLSSEFEPLSLLPGGQSLGRCAGLGEAFDAKTLACRLQKIFHSGALRFHEGTHGQYIRKIAWCTGSGGDLIPDAIAAGADALITGDCKQSVWIDAQNRGYTLFDCGHFETEAIAVQLLRHILQTGGADAELLISKEGTKPPYSVVKSLR